MLPRRQLPPCLQRQAQSLEQAQPQAQPQMPLLLNLALPSALGSQQLMRTRLQLARQQPTWEPQVWQLTALRLLAL